MRASASSSGMGSVDDSYALFWRTTRRGEVILAVVIFRPDVMDEVFPDGLGT